MLTIKQIKKDNTQSVYEVMAKVIDMHRTAEGLNLFVINDGTASIKLTKFVPGETLFADVNKEDIVKVQFTKKEYKGDLQGEPMTMQVVTGDDANKVHAIINEAKEQQFQPKDDTLLIQTETFEKLKPSLLAVATEIRKAIFNKRPIHISHHNDTDGYSAGVAVERAVLAAIQHYFPEERMTRNYLSRQPSRTPWYDLADASKDVGIFSQNAERYDVAKPLIVILDNGSTKQDVQAIEKVKLFGADVVVVDHHDPGTIENGKSEVCKHTLAHCNPHLIGVTEGVSASMLCYQLCYYIFRHDEPSAFVGAAGGVDDRCTGAEIDTLIAKTNYDREYIAELGDYINYEIYQLRSFPAIESLLALMYGDDTIRSKLMQQYRDIFSKAKEEIKQTVKQYHTKETIGKYNVLFLNGEDATIRGDYFSLGKVADILFDSTEIDNKVGMIYSNAMIVFRAQQDIGFDVNKIIPQLQEKLPYARVSGGGHAVAGSIRFVPYAKDEIIATIKELLQ